MIKNEKGYTLAFVLIFSLFISLLAFVILSAVLSTSAQIKKVDQHQKKLDIGELAIQDAKLQLAALIYEEISPESGDVKVLGNNDTNLKVLMGKIRNEWNSTSKGPYHLGSNGEPTYMMEINTLVFDKAPAYSYEGDKEKLLTSEQAFNLGIHAYRITFPLKITVMSEESEVKELSCDYHYSLQWISKKAGELAVQMDYWGSNHKAIDVKNDLRFSNPNYTARTFSQLSEIQKGTGYYSDLGLNKLLSGPVSNQIFGKRGEYLVDYGDKEGTLDLSSLNNVGENNILVGSFIIEKGVNVLGNSNAVPNASLAIHNMLKLSNLDQGSPSENYLKDVSLEVGTGLVVRLNPRENEVDSSARPTDIDGDGVINTIKKNSRLIIDNDPDKHKITTPNLWVNGAINNQQNDDSGFNLIKGKIHVKETVDKVDLNNYRPSSVYKSITNNESWKKLSTAEGGALMITNSIVKLAPTHYKVNGTSHNSHENDIRQIVVDGNFSISSMNYHLVDNDIDNKYIWKYKAMKRSILLLSGQNTSMQVKGLSHIDAAKSTKKMTLTAELTEPLFNRADYFSEAPTKPTGYDGLTKIELKNQSRIQLGYTSVEPFELAMENNTVFRMKVVPNVLFFDTTFLKDWKAKGSNGKIVLEVGSSSDLTKVKKLLTDLGVSSNTVNQSTGTYDDSAASNGKVTLVYSNTGNQDTLQYINRTSAFIENIKY